MSTEIQATGQCVCGSIRITADHMKAQVGACHCNTCRRWGGGPWFAVECGTEVTIEGDPTVFDSSEWAERGFCGRCGSHLFYRLKGDGMYILSAGLFQQAESQMDFDHQVFVDEKPGFYDFRNDTKNMTGPEVFALYSGSSEPPA